MSPELTPAMQLLLDEGRRLLSVKADEDKAEKAQADYYRRKAWRTLLDTAAADFGPLAYLICQDMPKAFATSDNRAVIEVVPFGHVPLYAFYYHHKNDCYEVPHWKLANADIAAAKGNFFTVSQYRSLFEDKLAVFFPCGAGHKFGSESLAETLGVCEAGEASYRKSLEECQQKNLELKRRLEEEARARPSPALGKAVLDNLVHFLADPHDEQFRKATLEALHSYVTNVW